MTLDTAIEVLADLLGEGPYYDPEHRREAVQLGIEALKYLRWAREQGQLLWDDRLPGETVEGPHSPLTDAEREIVDREYKAGCAQLREWYANGKLSGGEHGNP